MRRQIQTFTQARAGHFLLVLSCLLLLLTGCAGSSSGTGGVASVAGATMAPSSPASPKSDAHSNSTEEAQQRTLTKVNQILQGMTLDEKLAQMILVEYVGADYQQSGLQQMVKQNIGGYLIQPDGNSNFSGPVNTIDAVKAFNAQAQQDAKIPMLVALDQEGGLVNKLSLLFGDAPSATGLANTGDPNQASQEGVKVAQEMKQVGINIDLAPVVDVGPTSNLLETRMFSNDPQTVATYAGAFLDGLQKNGIPGCLKHYPGLGTIPQGQDPHQVIPHDTRSLSEIQNKDFIPYKQIIQKNNPAMIMSTDVFTDAIDANLPAELSPKAISMLRNDLGYKGVIITDGIYMIQRAGYMNIVPASKQAIIAGNDIVEGPFTTSDVDGVLGTLKQAVQSGELSQQQVDDSVRRILTLKVEYGIIPA